MPSVGPPLLPNAEQYQSGGFSEARQAIAAWPPMCHIQGAGAFLARKDTMKEVLQVEMPGLPTTAMALNANLAEESTKDFAFALTQAMMGHDPVDLFAVMMWVSAALARDLGGDIRDTARDAQETIERAVAEADEQHPDPSSN